jgi:hypothetical protein
VASVTPVSSLGRSCRAPATFNKAMVKGFVVFAGLGLRWTRSQTVAGAAGSSAGAGLLSRMLRRSLVPTPAGCSALGLSRYSSPRQEGVWKDLEILLNHVLKHELLSQSNLKGLQIFWFLSFN